MPALYGGWRELYGGWGREFAQVSLGHERLTKLMQIPLLEEYGERNEVVRRRTLAL